MTRRDLDSMSRDGVFFRLLAQLEAPLLQRHCAAAFEKELGLVRAQVDDVLAAYARLQEVREAVARVEDGRTDVGRTPSMIATADATAKEAAELMERMGVVSTLLKASRELRSIAGEQSEATEVEVRGRKQAARGRQPKEQDDSETEDEQVAANPNKVRPAKRSKNNDITPSQAREHNGSAIRVTKRSSREEDAKELDDSDTEDDILEVKKMRPTIRTETKESTPTQPREPYDSRVDKARGTKRPSREEHSEEQDNSETEEEELVAKVKKARPARRSEVSVAKECTPTPAQDHSVSHIDHQDLSQEVGKALAAARKLEDAAEKTPPTKKELSEVVKHLLEILGKVTLQEGQRLRGVSNGHFVLLLLVLERLFSGLKHRRFSMQLVKNVINAMEKAIARDSALASLSQYRDRFAEIKAEMEYPNQDMSAHVGPAVPSEVIVIDDIPAKPALPTALVTDVIPERQRDRQDDMEEERNAIGKEISAALSLHSKLERTHKQPPSNSQLGAFTSALIQILKKVKLKPGESMRSLNNGSFKGLFATSTRYFVGLAPQTPSSKLRYIRRIVKAMKSAIAGDRGLEDLSEYRTALEKCMADVENSAKDAPKSLPLPEPFQNLATFADDTCKLQVGKRSDRIVQFLELLTTQLRVSFPKKTKHPLPGKTMDAAAQVTTRAAEMIIAEPLSAPDLLECNKFGEYIHSMMLLCPGMKTRLRRVRLELIQHVSKQLRAHKKKAKIKARARPQTKTHEAK